MASSRRRTPCFGAVLENTLIIEQSSSGFVFGQCRYFCNPPRKSLPYPLTSDYLSARVRRAEEAVS
jgi:hypothetical protein